MTGKVLGLLLAVGAGRCCDPRHDLLATGVNRVEECRGSGGVAVTGIIVDQSGHAFVQLARCDFPIPLQREHLLPKVEQYAGDARKEAE